MHLAHAIYCNEANLIVEIEFIHEALVKYQFEKQGD
jgi:hypothetical protein